MAPWVWPVILGWGLGLASSLIVVLAGSTLADNRKRRHLKAHLRAELPPIIRVLNIIVEAYKGAPTSPFDYSATLGLTDAVRKGFDYHRPNLVLLPKELHWRVFQFYTMMESLVHVYKDNRNLLDDWHDKFNDLLEQGQHILEMVDKQPRFPILATFRSLFR